MYPIFNSKQIHKSTSWGLTESQGTEQNRKNENPAPLEFLITDQSSVAHRNIITKTV